MRTSSRALILWVILTIVSWCLVIFQEIKKRAVNKIPSVSEEKIERHLLAAKGEKRINTLKKEVDNISQSPWIV